MHTWFYRHVLASIPKSDQKSSMFQSVIVCCICHLRDRYLCTSLWNIQEVYRDVRSKIVIGHYRNEYLYGSRDIYYYDAMNWWDQMKFTPYTSHNSIVYWQCPRQSDAHVFKSMFVSHSISQSVYLLLLPLKEKNRIEFDISKLLIPYVCYN